ncbi:MAG TPA: LptA/OstA family protein [Bacteroidia bacterium]|nr:LptA/OstA family protein [Bacteroidia bacterium]
MRPHPLLSLISAPLLGLGSLAAQDAAPAAAADPAAEIEAAGKSIMTNPRLRNVLRNVKPPSEDAMQDADSTVRDLLRDFQTKTDGIDADKLKAAAAKAQADGTLEQVIEKASDTVKEMAPEALEAAKKMGPEAADLAGKAEDLLATPVPATRPAPGISGGAPTPVAMPVEEGLATPEEVEAPAQARPDGEMAKADAPNDAVDRTSSAEPIAGAAPTTPAIPDSPYLKPGDVPAPTPLKKKYATDQSAGENFPAKDKNSMQILSLESVMDNANHILTFSGNVFVDAPEYQMKCDKLQIYLADGVGMDAANKGGESNASFKRAVATGGMVEIKRFVVEEGKKKTQVALGRIADYNAITKDFVLSGGPPYIQDGDRFVKTTAQDAKIIMRGNGLYEVTGTTSRSQIVIPVEQKPGQKGMSDFNNIGGSMDLRR